MSVWPSTFKQMYSPSDHYVGLLHFKGSREASLRAQRGVPPNHGARNHAVFFPLCTASV